MGRTLLEGCELHVPPSQDGVLRALLVFERAVGLFTITLSLHNQRDLGYHFHWTDTAMTLMLPADSAAVPGGPVSVTCTFKTVEQTMLSAEDVNNAYRLILGREPESFEVVEDFARTIPDIGTLRKLFLESDEFTAARVVKLSQELDQGPSLHVDVDVDTTHLQLMLARVERTWQSLGNTEPFWSVLTGNEYRLEHFGQNEARYYDSGRQDATRLISWLDRNGMAARSSLHTCCEYGCGTGRVTRWLAEHFRSVIACDISQPHLSLAKQHTDHAGVSNVVYRHIDSLDTLKSIGSVDVVYSSLVLQHNPPPVIAFILRNMFSWLKPGGIAFFQVPTYCSGYRFVAEDYLIAPLSEDFEMHMLPQRYVYAIAAQQGCEPLEVLPDGCVGAPNWISSTFLFRKLPLSR